jgi:hypothetical protein
MFLVVALGVSGVMWFLTRRTGNDGGGTVKLVDGLG